MHEQLLVNIKSVQKWIKQQRIAKNERGTKDLGHNETHTDTTKGLQISCRHFMV